MNDFRASVAIVTQAEPDGSGGLATVVRWLTQSLPEHGFRADVHVMAASAKDPLSRRALSPGSWRHRPGHSRRDGVQHWGADWVEWEPQRYRPRAPLTRALQGYDVVLVVSGAPAIACAVAHVEVPTFLHVATTFAEERPAQMSGHPLAARWAKRVMLPLLNRMDVAAVRSVGHVLVENSSMLGWVRGQGQLNVSLIPPGVDSTRFAPQGSWSAHRPILAFGRLAEARKDWRGAVAAFEGFVGATGAANRLVLAGRGPVPRALARRVAASPLADRIELRTDVSAADLPGLMRASSVFLQSSLEEGFGIAGLEAMASGLPVVATATVGAGEYVVDGVNGFLTPLGPGSPRGLALSLVRVLVGGGGERLSQAAVDTARTRHDPAAHLSAMVGLYKRALGPRQASP